jgi:magnesium chelatase family protein
MQSGPEPLQPYSAGIDTLGSALTCFCTAEEIHRYWRKFGAALLDRVELRVAVRSPGINLLGQTQTETSETIRRRVIRAVEMQETRFRETSIRRNARMTPGMIERYCSLTHEAEQSFTRAVVKLGLSGRAFHGILRVARTIADLEGKDTILPVHILEAVQHRRLGEDPYDILSVEAE